MEPVQYDRIGNIPTYEHAPRKVEPVGLITTPDLVLKMYDMLFVSDIGYIGKVADAEKFITSEIVRGRISPETGLGFAILSKNMLNVVRWGKEYPIVAIQSLYQFNPMAQEQPRAPGRKGVFDSAEALDLNKVGSFCIWELGIAAHEKEAWKRFLASQRTNDDKKIYLDDTIRGDL
jgi:hypothetical protein